jgi:hypothetical protein
VEDKVVGDRMLVHGMVEDGMVENKVMDDKAVEKNTVELRSSTLTRKYSPQTDGGRWAVGGRESGAGYKVRLTLSHDQHCGHSLYPELAYPHGN